MSLFMSLVGMVALIAIAVLLSDNRKAINLRTVGGAFAINSHLVHSYFTSLGVVIYLQVSLLV